MRKSRGHEPITHPVTNSGHNPATRFEFAFLIPVFQIGDFFPARNFVEVIGNMRAAC